MHEQFHMFAIFEFLNLIAIAIFEFGFSLRRGRKVVNEPGFEVRSCRYRGVRTTQQMSFGVAKTKPGLTKIAFRGFPIYSYVKLIEMILSKKGEVKFFCENFQILSCQIGFHSSIKSCLSCLLYFNRQTF